MAWTKEQREDMLSIGIWFILASIIGGLIGGTVVALVMVLL